MIQIPRPAPGEYSAYQDAYVSKVPEGNVGLFLVKQREMFLAELRAYRESQTETGYAPGKWSLKEALGHVTDAERIFSYRALRIARGDEQALPGFEQDDYVAAEQANSYRWTELIAEFDAVRGATIAQVSMLKPEWLERKGTAADNPVTVRALIYLIAGHVEHHRRLLEKYPR